jgi:WXG100 family type VII secretion target
MGTGADGQIVYNFNTMSSAVQAIDTAVSNMRSTLAQLESDLRPLETEAWTSEAQMAYKIRKDRWHRASEHIAVLLGQVKIAVEGASERMRATDRKAQNYFPS